MGSQTSDEDGNGKQKVSMLVVFGIEHGHKNVEGKVQAMRFGWREEGDGGEDF